MKLSFRFHILVLLLGITISWTTILTFYARNAMQEAIEKKELDHARNVLKLITLHLEETYNGSNFIKNKSLHDKKKILHNITSLTISYMDSISRQVETGKLPLKTAQYMVAENLKAFRYNNNDYLYAVDLDYTIVAHPDPRLMGQNSRNIQDRTGFYIARSIIKKVAAESSGFTTYYWKRLANEKVIPKLTYWIYYPEWKWIIVSGLYLDDIEKEFELHKTFLLQEIKKTFQRLTIGKAGYLFLFTGEKKVLIHPNITPEENFAAMVNPVNGNLIADELIEAAHNTAPYFEYIWDKPEFKNNFKFKKIAIITYFEPFDWYIGYSVYEDDIELPARELTRSFLYIAAGLLAAVFILSIFLSKAIVKPIKDLITVMSRIKEKGFVAVPIPRTKIKEINQLGEFFTGMIKSLKDVHEKLEKTNNSVLDSIRYAGLIQRSILPTPDVVEKYLPDSFLLWEPRDIVSGDFYQIYPVEDGFFLFIGDCTGHGVPGGFLTMFCISAIRRIIFSEKMYDPADILTRLDCIIQTSLQNLSDGTASRDGLDGAICFINIWQNTIKFCGAKLNLYITYSNGEVTVIKGARFSIGYGSKKQNKEFHTIDIPYNEESIFYLTTDGLLEQTGGKRNICFGKNRFQQFLSEAAGKPFSQQKELLVHTLKAYQGEHDRLDDLTVIGFKVQ